MHAHVTADQRCGPGRYESEPGRQECDRAAVGFGLGHDRENLAVGNFSEVADPRPRPPGPLLSPRALA